MSNRGTLQFLVQLFLMSIECIVYFSDFVCQVAALNFGDFYNVQYVNMYTIFIGQLRVNYLSPCVIFFFFFLSFGLLLACLGFLPDGLYLFSYLQTILPPTTNIPEAYSSGSGEEQVSIFCALGFKADR